MFCPMCGKDVGDKSFCTQCGAAVSAEAIEMREAQGVTLPMKWFKFLIWFALFASAVLNGLTGLNMLTGAQYGDLAKRVYTMFKDLKSVDTIFGILLIGLAAFAVYTRFRLAKYCKNGPTMLLIVYIANFVIGLAYTIAVDSATRGLVDGESQVVSMVTSIAMIIANAIYFKKRNHLFVN